MRNYLLAAVSATMLASPAFAQEGGPFTGLRVGAIGGYDMLRSGDDNDDGVDTGEDEGDESVDGAVFGVDGGYDFDLGGVVAGVEAEFTESTGEQEASETVDGVEFTGRLETGRDLYIGGRLGFVASPNLLAYVKGGYTNLSLETAFESGSERLELDTNADGFRLGGGLEFLFGTNAYGKVEYRYSNYNKLDFDDDFDEGDLDPDNFQTDIDLDRHQVVAGVGIRF